ncbi:MAG: sugar nucleotide-binding protein [Pseudomonadota bacterium]
MTSVLIVGGDSQIGSLLAEMLSSNGYEVTVSSRRSPLSEHAVHIDLKNPDPAIAASFDTIVLSAAITARRDCEADPALARQINVDAPLALAAPVLDAGGQVIFLSTSIVLGGDNPYLPHDAPYAPFDHYSRHKAEAEQKLLALADRSGRGRLVILRMAKVMDASTGVVADWARSVKSGRPFSPYTDLVNAPVTTAHLTSYIANLIRTQASGIRHVSGEEHSYAEIARRLAERLDWPEHLMQPVEGRSPVCGRSLHMNVRRLKHDGYRSLAYE